MQPRPNRSAIDAWLPPPTPAVPGSAWPQMLGPRQARFRDLLRLVDRSQWWDPERLRAGQLEQASTLVAYAARHSPFHARRLREAGINPAHPVDEAVLQRIPLLTRRDLQERAVHCERIPQTHGKSSVNSSSGSTGTPVRVRVTSHYAMFYQALCARDHAWHERDPTAKICSIRFLKQDAEPADASAGRGWACGPTWNREVGSGTVMNVARPVREQADWLLRERPDYLSTYPSNVAALIEEFEGRGKSPEGLRQVLTLGETLPDALRERVREHWAVPVRDIYSCEELGYIASECPDGGGYHVHAEGVLVEVLDEAGHPCGPGETGRLVVTGLHNFATPLIRYELRDWAEVGVPCGCGRGLPVLRRILGRTRNLLRLPNGDRHWAVGMLGPALEFPVRQFQYVQKSLERIEVRLVPRRPFAPDEIEAFVDAARDALGHPFELDLVWLDEIPVAPNGKHEEFVCEVPD